MLFRSDCCPDYTIERQWTAIDCSGNSTVCTQVISFSPGVNSNTGNAGMTSMNNEVVSGDRTTTIISVAPNPANTYSQFTFKTAETLKTTFEVLDMTGKKVAELYNGIADAGTVYTVNLDVRNIAPGVYMCRLINGYEVQLDRLIIGK